MKLYTVKCNDNDHNEFMSSIHCLDGVSGVFLRGQSMTSRLHGIASGITNIDMSSSATLFCLLGKTFTWTYKDGRTSYDFSGEIGEQQTL